MTRYEAMEEYHRNVKPYLGDIEHYSKMAALSVRRLALRPAFITNAQAEMLALEKSLVDALEIVRAAQAEYGTKPVESEHAA